MQHPIKQIPLRTSSAKVNLLSGNYLIKNVSKGPSSDAITAHPGDTGVEFLIEHLQMKSSLEISAQQRNPVVQLAMDTVMKEWEKVILPFSASKANPSLLPTRYQMRNTRHFTTGTLTSWL